MAYPAERTFYSMVSWMQSVDDHRAELRELNELSVARIEARFGQVDARFGQLEARMGRGDLRARVTATGHGTGATPHGGPV